MAHRYSYQLETICPENFGDYLIIQTCGDKLCVNPKHLTIRPRKTDEVERFWGNVSKLNEANGGCWVWIGRTNKCGYGSFSISNKEHKRAHRYSWELRWGKLSSSRIMVCHKCDIRVCVNPDHLFIGLAEDNNRDCIAKGRNAHGLSSGRHKLTLDNVKEILTSNLSNVELGKKFSVDHSSIARIRSGKGWKQTIANLDLKSNHLVGKSKKRLTIDDIRFIKQSAARSIDLEKQFNISRSQISRIRKGLRWGHVV